MKLVIPGGSGHLGRLIVRRLAPEGHELVVLGRRPEPLEGARVLAWDARTVGNWAAELEGADAVVNLAGRSVDCRYGSANRQAILASRVDSVRALGWALAAASDPPPVWLQMSTATIYAHTFGPPHDEGGTLGGDEPGAPDTWRFSIDVARAWEDELRSANTPRTRRVLLRTAMVMDDSPGGAYRQLVRLVRLGLSGRAGSGEQFVSWIHGADFVRALVFLLGAHELDGPVNVCAPSPLPYVEFMRTLRREMGQPVALPAPASLVELSTFLLRTESELVLKSRRVVPGRLAAAGFRFDFPTWPDAARELAPGLWPRSARSAR